MAGMNGKRFVMYCDGIANSNRMASAKTKLSVTAIASARILTDLLFVIPPPKSAHQTLLRKSYRVQRPALLRDNNTRCVATTHHLPYRDSLPE